MTYQPPFNGGRINATISGNTAGAGTLISSGTLALAGGNNITLSQNGNTITVSGAPTPTLASNTMGISNLGNTSGTSGVVSGSALRFAFAGGNNVTLSQSINASSATITISAANQTVQTQSNLQALYDGANSVTTGTVRLSNANGVSFGLNGQTLTASVAAQSSPNLSLYAAGNTTQNSSSVMNGSSLMFNGLGGVSVGYSAGSIQISGVNGGGGGGGGVALANSQATYSSGTVNLLEGGGAITIASSPGGQSFMVSVPETSSLAATGIVSLSTNASTISIGAPAFSAGVSNLGSTSGNTGTVSNQVVFAGSNITLSQSTGAGGATVTISGNAGGGAAGGTLSNWEPLPLQYGSLTATEKGNANVFFYKLQPEANISASRLVQLASISASSSSNSSHAAVVSLAAGIYTANGSSLSLITQSSGSIYYQWTNTSNSSLSVITGLQGMSMPLNMNISPGNYWLGMWSRTSSTNANWASISNIVFSNNTNYSYQGLLLQTSNATQGVQEGVGYLSVSSTALPVSAAMSQITQSVFKSNVMPYMVFKNMTW